MAKISKFGGPTIAGEAEPNSEQEIAPRAFYESHQPPLTNVVPDTGQDKADATADAAHIVRGDEPSPGNSSEASSEKRETNDEQPPSESQRLAPTTENPSGKGQTDPSTASTMAGSPEQAPRNEKSEKGLFGRKKL